MTKKSLEATFCTNPVLDVAFKIVTTTRKSTKLKAVTVKWIAELLANNEKKGNKTLHDAEHILLFQLPLIACCKRLHQSNHDAINARHYSSNKINDAYQYFDVILSHLLLVIQNTLFCSKAAHVFEKRCSFPQDVCRVRLANNQKATTKKPFQLQTACCFFMRKNKTKRDYATRLRSLWLKFFQSLNCILNLLLKSIVISILLSVATNTKRHTRISGKEVNKSSRIFVNQCLT